VTPRCLILDFDGTFTDVAREAEPFVAAFRAEVADLLGRSIDGAWEEAAAEIARHPGRYGWVHEGHVVAPAGADPYIQSTTIAQRIFDGAGILGDPKTRAAVTSTLYHLAYEHTHTAFRPGAREVLEAIVASGIPAYVVTNARPDAVRRKLATLGPAGLEKLGIVGDAQKFVVGEPKAPDARFSVVPAERTIEGLERPVYPRRGRYFDALRAIMEATGKTPAEVLVCGDIYELDLSLPIELGMSVQLVTGASTPAHEIRAIEALGARGGHAGDLRAILARIGLA
jgi:FMN phosphatase YigB (HAD superfamily)